MSVIFAVGKKVHFGESRLTVRPSHLFQRIVHQRINVYQPLSGARIIFQSCLEFEKRASTQLDSIKNSLKIVNLPRHSVVSSMSFKSKHMALCNIRGDDGKVVQWCGSSGLLMSYTTFQPVVYVVRESLRYDATRCCTGTHNLSLSAIPTANAIFCWSRSTSCHVSYLGYLDICCQPIIVIAIIAYTSWHGLSWPRLAGSPDNTLRLVGSIGFPNN
jgi:hypothetical protein